MLMQSVCYMKIADIAAPHGGEGLTFYEPSQLREVRKDTAQACLPT